MRQGKKTFWVALVGVAVLFYAIAFSSDDFETFVAQDFTYVVSFKSQGLVFREEKGIDYQKGHRGKVFAEYLKQDGEHVEKDEILLRTYRTDSQITSQERQNYFRAQQERILDLLEHANNFLGSTEVLTRSPAELLIKLAKNLSHMELLSSYDSEVNLVTLINKKQLATGKGKGFLKQARLLGNKIAVCAAEERRAVKCYVSTKTGCFFSEIDGCEDNLAPNMVTSEFSDEQLLGLYNQMKLSQAKGVPNRPGIKIVTDYDWYVMLPLESVEASNIVNYNSRVILDFGFVGGRRVPAQLVRVIKTKNKDKTVLVFKSNYMNRNLAEMRMPKVEVCTEKVEGVLCPLSALRFVDGEKGVFVKEGEVIKFKKVEPVYEDKKMIISKAMLGNGYLERLDEIIIYSNEPLKKKAI